MKQVLQNIRSGKTSVEDVPAPAVRAGFALVRTAASLVSSGTERSIVDFAEKGLLGKARARPDLVKQVMERARREGVLSTARAALNRLDQPMALGYSSAGTILTLGSGMRGFRVGQRVACAGSGFAVHAEFAVVPRQLLTPIPDAVDFESAAFVTLAAVAMHGFRLAKPQVGEKVAVIGLGLLGMLAAKIAEAAGCMVLGIDTDPHRVELAKRLGLRAVARAVALQSGAAFTVQRGFDSVLICAHTPSSDPVQLAAGLARDRARVIVVGAVGLEIPRGAYYQKELMLVNARSYGPGRYDAEYEEAGHDYPAGYVRWTEGRNMEAVVGLLADGSLDVRPLITHRFPIDQAVSAYDLMRRKRGAPYLGLILTYDAKRAVSAAKISLPAPVAQRAGAVRLGVIGAGNFAGAVLLPAIKRAGSVQLVGIASPGGLHAKHTGGKYGFSYATAQVDELLADSTINTIAILTRHDSHADLAVRALNAGKHVFVEKPLAINERQLRKVIAALREATPAPSSQSQAAGGACLLTVGFNRRFSPLGMRLEGFLSGRVEPLHVHYRVNAGYLPLDHWVHDQVVGGGRIIGEGCHFLDFLAFLVGSPPVMVEGRALPDVGRYREDNVSITFTFADGSLGVLDYLANGDKSFSKERLEVFCGGKVAVLDDFRTLEMIENGKRTLVRRPQDKGWVNEWRVLTKAIVEGGVPPIPYEHLVGITRATFQAVDSLRKSSPPAN